VIIVDDGSSDGSGEEAAEYFKEDPRVRVEHKPNGGCASARNYGRLVSDATHIAFVDADDFVTPNFFGDLYDLALYTGSEITQGGFDFYDETRKEPYYPSYEDALFEDLARDTFAGQPVFRLQSADIIKGQPTIWRKVYRRDFLDAKDIYFPENVRAYDDYIFQMFTLTAARDIMMMPEHKYHYRQHPAQDIRQGDERHFYMLHMFQVLLRRSINEGWSNFRPYAESILDSIAWSAGVLRTDLVDTFLQASARFCVSIAKVYGADVIEDLLGRVGHPDFKFHYSRESRKAAGVTEGAFWSYFYGELYHPDMIRMRQAMRKVN
jgi:glycosyltransferase involved in cell wall biosynthesis